jgi:beta-glucanase (GH16 family)
MTASVALISLVLVGALLVTTEVQHSPEPARPAGHGVGSIAWSDEFNGRRGTRPDPRKWSFETGYGWGDRELQSYTRRPANASLDGRGHLAITARRERYTGADGRTARYTSARINSRKRFEFAYGRVEARIRVPRGRGLLPAFWALGRDLDGVGWPAAGEIDVMEALRGAAEPLASGFHVYGMSWSPGRIAFRLDGEVYAVQRRSDVPAGAIWGFDRPFFLLLNLAVGPRWLGAPDATTRWPARMLVDWVRVRRGRATYCPTVRSGEFRRRCPQRPRARPSAASEPRP